jgi:hypothetical protein
MAKYDAAVGDLYGSYDSETKTVKAGGQAALLKARTWYQRSEDTLRTLQQRDPVRFDKNSLDEVSQKLSACDAKLKS